MKTLLVLRHAKSDWSEGGLDDFDRPLNDRGRRTAPEVGRALSSRNLLPDLVLSSTAVRARQTVELLLPAAKYVGEVQWKDDFYLAPPEIYLNALRQLGEPNECVMVVGHNPGLEALEVFPMVAEMPFLARFQRIRDLAHRVHHFAPVLAIIGMCLSLLHQSSLGGTYGVVVGRAALFRPTMPLLFIVSAAAAGIAFTIHTTLIVQWLTHRQLVPDKILLEAGQISGAILLLYLYMRFWDTTAGNYGYVPGKTEAFTELSAGPFALTFWAWEIFLGGLLAAILLVRARFRGSITLLFIGTGLTMAGMVANRWHTTLLAFTQPLAEHPAVTNPLISEYTPALTEWATALGVLAILALAFSLGMRYLPAFNPTSDESITNT